ncbi:hypothetical protein KXJ72_14805 [Comamonas aquatica]|nr:hypothetical protein KXJ72_14805 [Comamonas aquatica]
MFLGSGADVASAGSSVFYGCFGTCVRGRVSTGGDPISFVLPKETGERKGAPCRRLARRNSLRACSAPFKQAAGKMKGIHNGWGAALCLVEIEKSNKINIIKILFK